MSELVQNSAASCYDRREALPPTDQPDMTKSLDFKSLALNVRRDPGRPSTWTSYRDGLCAGCQALCCTLPVDVSLADLIQLNLLTPEQSRLPFRQITRHLEEQGVIEAAIENSQSFILRQTESGVCRYLGADRRCSVYDRRPEVCRTFPAIGPRPGFCPANPLKATPRKDRP
jgi:Fe-S-cluster containining protein